MEQYNHYGLIMVTNSKIAKTPIPINHDEIGLGENNLWVI